MEFAGEAPAGARERAFGRLGRWIVKHPVYPIVFWVVLLLVALPFLSLLGSVTTNSFTTVSSSAPSAVAAARLAQLFPNESGGSSTTILLVAPNMTDANAQGVVLAVTSALERDRSLQEVAAIDSVYVEYAQYLAGQVRLANGVIVAGAATHPSLAEGIANASTLLWGPPALYVENWEGLAAHAPEPADANWPALLTTSEELANSTASLVLSTFYNGTSSGGTGFNGTYACAADPGAVATCADAAARTNEGPLIPVLVPNPAQQLVPRTVLAALGVENSTNASAQRSVGARILSDGSGLPAPWILSVWNAFPTGVVSPGAASEYANGTVANVTLWSEPLPVPYAILSQFVNPDGTAQIVQVSFSVGDDTTNSSGGNPVDHDLGVIGGLVPGVIAANDPSRSISYYQTGGAALDQLTNQAIDSALTLVLPLTVGLLLAISMLYFRSPITPLVSFGGLAIALVLGLGGTVLLGTFVEHIDTTALTLEEVFVLGVGTDYSIFLIARYREELVRGRSPDDAIVRALTWAGQSVATSGATAIIATLALAFSGVALLAEWGMVLSLAIFLTLVLSLTIVPAFLKLIGPRIFWPTTGERFRRHAAAAASRAGAERTYFYRAGRASQRHPRAVLGVALLVSIPLVAVALTVPLSYDFYEQLPKDHSATTGLAELGNAFGPGFSVPSFVLVTFASPPVVGNTTNATEFLDLANLTDLANGTSGIASVNSPIGPSGAPLPTWLALSSVPSATRENLLGTWSGYVGLDHRTVLLTLVPASAGLSTSAVAAVGSVEASYGRYATAHPEVTALAYGGGAPTINDLATQTAHATDYLLLAVTIGLVVVLLVVLRSWIIALMGVATIGLSISWAWALTYLVFQQLLGFPLFFFVETVLFILILGLGIDYNIFLLTRVREERVRGRSSSEAAVEGVARTGGIITAAAVILASAFAALTVGDFVIIEAIGFSVAIAILLDAMVVRTYVVPAALQLFGDRVWTLSGRKPKAAPTPEGPAENPP